MCCLFNNKKYLTLTEDLRQPSSNVLFITYKKPYGPASKQTLSRWVKNTRNLTGVDTSLFTAHSTRQLLLQRPVEREFDRSDKENSRLEPIFVIFYQIL